jgi:hypothetical protein
MYARAANSFSANNDVVSCASLAALPALGSCPSSATEVELSPMQLMTDNPLYLNRILPLVGPDSPATGVNLHRLRLDTLLVKTSDPATLERVRTYLATDPAVVAATDNAQANAGVVPETFGESAAIRSQDVTNVQHLVLAAVLLTLIIASCGLAVTVGGGLLERRRPFTLLRLSGTSLATLRRVVLLESALPLVAGAIVAVAAGLGVAAPFTRAALPATVHTSAPSGLFFLTTGAGILTALVVVAAALPLLARITDPAQARFE